MKKQLKLRVLSLVLVLTMVLSIGCGNDGKEEKDSNRATLATWQSGTENNDPTKETTTKDDATKETTTKDTPVVENPKVEEYKFSIYDKPADVTYTDEQLAVQEAFKKFLDDEFIDTLESSYFNTIYTLDDLNTYDITFDEISWGEYSVEYMNEYKTEVAEGYEELLNFDASALDYEGKLIYDSLKIYFENELVGSEYWYFSEPFSPMNGIQSSLPILMAEIEFKDAERIDNYMLLLTDIDRYIADIITVEKHRALTYGLFLTKVGAEDVMEQCNDFVNAEENVLLTSFEERINACTFLTDEQKATYIAANEDAVKNEVIPAFKSIANTCKMLKGTRKHDSIKMYEGGDKYYEYLVKENASTTTSLDDLLRLTESYMDSSLQIIQNIASKDTTAIYQFSYGEYPVSDPKESLSYFADKLQQDFPKPVTTKYDLKYVPKSLESSSSPAFYIIAPIDNKDKNIIYINGSDEYEGQNLYATLAHEGFPGHMYQTTYFYSVNPHPIRTVLSFNGYVEGYAMYSERYAYDYSGFTDNTIALLKANDVYGYGLYSLVDFYVNYKGWSYSQVEAFLVGEGYDKEIAKEVYYIMLDDPCIYHRYFLGLIQYLEAYDNAKELLGDKFANIHFNKFILEIGPTYFNIINDRMVDWAKKIS